MEARLEPLTEADQAEWRPLMHKPPQSLIEVQLSESLRDGSEQCHSLLQALLTQWESYGYDLGAYKWVSALLRDFLPADRIIRHEPPPPGPPPAWIWVNGIYKKNKLHKKNEVTE